MTRLHIAIASSALVIAGSLLPQQALAQADTSCVALFRHNLVEAIKAQKADASRLTILHEVCTAPRGDPESNPPLFGGSLTPTPSSRQLLQMKKVLCGKARTDDDLIIANKALRPWIQKESRDSYRTCLALKDKGVELTSVVSGEERETVNLSLRLRDTKVKIRGFDVSPPDAFNCEGPITRLNQSWGFDQSNLYLSCQRNEVATPEGAVISLRTSSGRLDFNFGAFSPTQQIDYDALLPVASPTPARIPRISGCRTTNAAERIVTCDNSNSWILCYREMTRGTIVNCEANYSPTIFRGRREVQIRPEANEHRRELNGRLRVEVTRGQRGQGQINESVNYTINFDTPEPRRRARAQCDPSCPICGPDACNRACVFADHTRELDENFGVAFIGRSPAPSCENPVQGTIRLSDVQKFYAYNLCEHRNAWGQFIEGTLNVKVSKFYWFNDQRTTFEESRVQRGNQVRTERTWTVTNPGERYRAIADMNLPVEITCRVVH